jgi:hypothetical protein
MEQEGKMKKEIVVFDLSEKTFDIYKDISAVASDLGISPRRLKGRIEGGVWYTGMRFVGYGERHKSTRGGVR